MKFRELAGESSRGTVAGNSARIADDTREPDSLAIGREVKREGKNNFWLEYWSRFLDSE